MINLQLLAVFAAVAEHQSFSRAALQLGVGKGTVSRAITRLEGLLEVELLHRTTHHVALSTAGLALYERVGQPVSALRRAVVDLPELAEEPSGLLRLTAPPDLGAVVLPPLLTRFARRFPAIRFDIRLTGARLDLVKEGFDLAIRAGTRSVEENGLDHRVLGSARLAFFAAPSYIARRGRPRHLGDERHNWILHSGVQGVATRHTQFVSDDFFLIRGLLRDGAGLGVLPDFVARPNVAEGDLEEVSIRGHEPRIGHFKLLFPPSAQRSNKVRAFSDFLFESFQRNIV